MIHLTVRTRNSKCYALRDIEVPKKTILRLGSVTPTAEITRKTNVIEINPAEACAISSDKRATRRILMEAGVSIADECVIPEDIRDNHDNIVAVILKYMQDNDCNIIAKRYNSSKGKGLLLLDSPDAVESFVNFAKIENWVLERYYTYSREYRIHVTKDGCFLADRKMLINGADERWHRHETNSVWINENNELFNKPINWEDIVADCVKAMKAIGLDICCFDVKVQNDKHENPKWIIMESNSAPGLNDSSIELYREQIKKIINERTV